MTETVFKKSRHNWAACNIDADLIGSMSGYSRPGLPRPILVACQVDPDLTGSISGLPRHNWADYLHLPYSTWSA